MHTNFPVATGDVAYSWQESLLPEQEFSRVLCMIFASFSACQSWANTEIKTQPRWIMCSSAGALFSSEWRGNGGAVMHSFCSSVTLMNSSVLAAWGALCPIRRCPREQQQRLDSGILVLQDSDVFSVNQQPTRSL